MTIAQLYAKQIEKCVNKRLDGYCIQLEPIFPWP